MPQNLKILLLRAEIFISAVWQTRELHAAGEWKIDSRKLKKSTKNLPHLRAGDIFNKYSTKDYQTLRYKHYSRLKLRRHRR